MDEALNPRAQLRFADRVKTAFSFVETEWGFREVETLVTRVRWESDRVYIQVYHGRISCEVGVEVGLRADKHDDNYDLGELLELVDPTAAEFYRCPAGRTESAVQVAVSECAELFHRVGFAAAHGDAETFRRLHENGVKRVRKRVEASMARRVRPKAEEAFRRADYQRAAELYTSIEPSLSKVELHKLAIARERSKG